MNLAEINTSVAAISGAGDFRRGSPVRRKRTHPLLGLVRPLAVSLLLVALPAALLAWIATSPRFALREVAVESSAPRLPAAGLRAAVAPLRGANLVLLPLRSVEAAVRSNPWVATVEIRKELPDRLRIEVTERRPVALLERGSGLVYADQKGQPIVPVGADELASARRAGLVVVAFAHPELARSNGVADALAVAGELGRVEPDWAAHLERIEVLGEEDYRLRTSALRFPLLVTKGQVGPKVERLKKLLPELDRRYPAIQAVDLRFSHRIVVQPAVPSKDGREIRS